MVFVQLAGIEERGQFIRIEPDFFSLHAAHDLVAPPAPATTQEMFSHPVPWPGLAWGGRGRDALRPD
jgi:hypothetical protein